MSRSAAPPPVILVGRGRMAGAFAVALRGAGAVFVTVRGRTLRGAAAARARFGKRPVLWVLAVTDAAIGSTAERLALAAALRRRDTVVHLAGARGLEPLAPARAAGAAVGALHPLVAVATPRDPPRLRGAAASFEGQPAALRAARAALAPTGLRVFAMTGADRVRYHAAAALVATGSVALAQGAEALFRASARRGVSDAAACAFASSLLASAAHNVAAVGADRALASPLMRGDTATVAGHLAAMEILPQARALYLAALVQVVGELARSRAVDAAVIARARSLLRTARGAGRG